MQEISWRTYKLHEAHSRANLARKLCVRVLNSRTVTQKFQPVFTEFFRMTPCMFLYIKRQINNQRIVCYYKKSANQTANGCFCCKIRSAIWGYPGSRATRHRHHMEISGIWSKQLPAPYGVSWARWVKVQR